MFNGLKTIAVVLLIGMLPFLTTPLAAQNTLPMMGEAADNALSLAEEKQLGAQLMRRIRASLPLVDDIQLTEFIQSLGHRLAVSAGNNITNEFTFFIIDDPAINAFAIPGGYVGINAGLITAMSREAQLASVIAHEIAHVTQRHHARAFATSNRASISAAATVLAAIIIGQASPQAGQAALAAGLAATQQSSINFTRGNEIEADRIGIEILSNAGYDPYAMAESFSILRRKNALNTSGTALEYLRTHPLDNNRIAEASDRAISLTQQKHAQTAPSAVDFELFKARLAVITSDDHARTLRLFETYDRQRASVSTAYALALLHLRTNRPDNARPYLKRLERDARLNPMIALLFAEAEKDQPSSKTMQHLTALSELYPERYSIIEKQLSILKNQSRHSEAMAIVKNYLRKTRSPAARAWRQLAGLQQSAGHVANSHESLAAYFLAIDERERAGAQLELALRAVAPDSQDHLRLSAHLKQLRQQAK